MEIQEQNIRAAYATADDNGKKLLLALFPEAFPDTEVTIEFKDERPVTERIKTLDDAIKELGEGNQLVQDYLYINDGEVESKDILAYLKLRIICAALNEGWTPQFTEDEVRWQPWFFLWTEDELSEKSEEWKRSHALIMTEGEYSTESAGFASAHSAYVPSNTISTIGSRLCLKSEALADHAARQFAAWWADFYLIRK